MEADRLRHCKEAEIGYLIPDAWKGFAQDISCPVAVCINAVPKTAQIITAFDPSAGEYRASSFFAVNRDKKKGSRLILLPFLSELNSASFK